MIVHLSIMITSVPFVCLLPDVRGRGAASPLTSHVTKGECTAVACHINKVRRSNIARTARQRRSWLGEWAATKLRLNMTTAPGPGAGVTGKQQRRYSGWAATALCVCRARQTAHWMSRQIQANSRGDRDGYHQCQTNQVRWHLPPGGNNAARKCDRQTFTR